MSSGAAIWRDGKIVSCSANLAKRKEPKAAALTAADAPIASSKKVSGTSPRLLAKPPVPHDDNPSLLERHPLTTVGMTEANEHLYYGPMKAVTLRLAELGKKYCPPMEKATKVVAEEVAARMYTASVATNKLNHDALMKKYVNDPSVKILTPEDGTLLIQRLYKASMEKQRETYEGLLAKYVPKREFGKLTKGQLAESAKRLSSKK